MLPARFYVSKTKDDNSSSDLILRPAVRLEDTAETSIIIIDFLEISMHQMLKKPICWIVFLHIQSNTKNQWNVLRHCLIPLILFFYR